MRRRGNKNELLNRHLQLGRICNMVLQDDSIIAWRRYVGCVSRAQILDTFQLLLTLRDMVLPVELYGCRLEMRRRFSEGGGGRERFRLQLKMHAVYSVAYYEKVLVVVMFENKMLI